MSKVICLFNHKGGVSKTTSTFHIGWMLASQGKKVLLVDADSQCNLTNLFMGENFEQFYQDSPKRNIKSALAPAFESQPIKIEAFECVESQKVDNLFLIPGSFDLTAYDVPLGVSFSLSEPMLPLRNLPGSFYYLLKETGNKYNVDYIIVDMNPSLSAINQVLFLSSDYFITPVSPDIFSQMAITSLSKILPKWENWACKARETFADTVYPLPKNSTIFLGLLMNRFNIRKGKPTKANQEAIQEIIDSAKKDFFPSLQKSQMTFEEKVYSKNFCLAEIPDFSSLNALYHTTGTPVFALTDQQLKVGGEVLKNYRDMTQRFNHIYLEITKRICNLTEND